MVSYNIFVACTLLIVAASTVLAYDPDLLQDFCVADLTANESVNGFPCKNRTTVTADDFFFAAGFNRPGNTSNALGFAVTPATVLEFPGLNTLGISMVRIDFAPNGGLNPLHTHPRASELLVLLRGVLFVGFVTSNPENRLFSEIIYPGDLFVFPRTLIHFQLSIGRDPAFALSGLNSQNPGVITIANAIFGTNPPIANPLLRRAFRIDDRIINILRAPFAP
ncbi:hypothetical protein ACHQM5_017969 [Ranunculus cassubicifolius]